MQKIHCKIRMSIFLHLSRKKIKHWHASILLGALVVFISVFGFVRSQDNLSYDSTASNEIKKKVNDEVKNKVEIVAVKKPPEHIKTPTAVRAAYMTSWVAGTQSIREKLIAFMEGSELNSVVVDIKDYTGRVAFETDNEVVRTMGSSEKRIADVSGLIEELHSKKIYVIGRIAVFQDPFATKKKPEWAVAARSGGIWHDRKGLAFIDPGAEGYWNYIVQIAKASEEVGFDEINFDYIRYPSDGVLSNALFPYAKGREKQIVLEDFFKYLHEQLKDTKIPISADLFGLATWAEDDLGIGQVLERAAPYFDFIAPMVYPSHYASGFGGYKNPAEHPYEIIKISMDHGIERMKKINQDPNKLRPWIQDFDLGADYGMKEIQAQKKAIYDAGLTSWMSWDPKNQYTQGAYQK